MCTPLPHVYLLFQEWNMYTIISHLENKTQASQEYFGDTD